MKKKTIVMLCVIALAVICAGIVFSPVLSARTDEKANRLIWDVEESWNEEDQASFKITFRCVDSKRRVSEVVKSYDANGNVDLRVTTRGLPLLASLDPQRRYSVELTDSDDVGIKKITLQTDIVLWEDGVTVDRLTAFMFDAVKHETDYSPKVQVIMNYSGVEYWGCISDEQGRDLGLTINEDVVKGEEAAMLEELKKYSCLLLALINDVEKVTWEYSFSGKEGTLHFEESDAAAILSPENGGNSIKEYGKTAAGLQRLIDQIDYGSSVFIG